MKKFLVLMCCLAFLLASCQKSEANLYGSADELLSAVMEKFELPDGYMYGKGEPMSDAMLARFFPEERLSDLKYVKTMAVYLSKGFSEGEILVLELHDPSHKDAVLFLLKKRAEKKEDAALFSDGVYLFLICTEKNKEILAFLKG